MALSSAVVEYHERVAAEVLVGVGMRHALEVVCGRIAREAASAAPWKTGAGAGSIHGEVVLTTAVDISAEGLSTGFALEGRVGWTPEHYYLYMHEKGWKTPRRKVRAKPFLGPAARRRRSV